MAHKALIIFTLILFLHVSLAAQSLYHLQYNFAKPADSTQYSAFLAFFEDGSGLLRLRYMHNNQDVVMEADITEKALLPNEAPDSTQTFFNFINPRLISGDTSAVHALPLLKFSTNKTTGFAEPSAMILPAGNNMENQAASGFTARLIERSALQKNFLRQFFNEDDDFYIAAFQPVTRSLNAVEKNTRLHLFIVANTKEKIIGGSCALDKERTLQTFAGLSQYLGIRMIVDSVTGNKYNKKNVENGIKKIKPSPNDIVVFYYSGHGYRKLPARSRFPSIDLRSKPSENHITQSMAIEDIYGLIKKKGARINLVLSDCCNNEVSETNITASKPLKMKSSGLTWSEDNIRQLFLNKTPMSVLATSADAGQKASGNTAFGGFFSYFFKTSMETYCSNLKTNPTWDVVLQTARMQTIQKASRTYCDKPYIPENICRQSPYYRIEMGR